ncbi:MFS transporter [Novosphingobium sp.]|uniref:MFS transporter n=1 Tax=Novosphingobium sp. TaxID=1874826 RepID=UPI0025CBDF18|nr:MFS transporter [Novosphingobium sp.]MCC6926596.1 MFS transporter [Novosphingobium sp.]
MSAVTAKPLPTRLAFFHGLGSIAYGIKDNGFSTFLLLYCNLVLGMDPRTVSFALMVALVIDGFVDPVVGYLSDRTVTNWGRRLPWLYLAPIPLGLAWYQLWSLSAAPSFWGLVAMAAAVRLLVSCCEVPSVALVPELTRDYDERTTLMRFRFLFGWGGGLLVMFLAYTVFLGGKGGLLSGEGYRSYGLFGAAMMTTAVLVSALGQHRRVAVRPPRPSSPLNLATAFGELKECFSHKAFLVLLLGGALAYTSQGVTFSMSNYLYLFIWRMPETVWELTLFGRVFHPSGMDFYPWVLFLSVVTCFFLMPGWHRRWGKRDTAVVTSVLGMIFWVMPFLFRAIELWPVEGSKLSTVLIFAFFFVCNVFSVAAMVSASSMMADVVEASEEQTGRRSEGVFFSGNFFMQKCATGLGIFITGQLLALANLPEKAKPGQVPMAVIDTLALTYVIVVFVFAVLIALVLRRFPITRADHEARVAALGAARLNPDAEGMHP